MSNEINKPNDMFVTSLLNPELDSVGMVQNNISPDNTGFMTMDEYKKSPFVEKTFSDSKGVFDNAAFQSAYVNAAKKYSELTDIDFYKNAEKSVEYSPTSAARPLGGKVRDVCL